MENKELSRWAATFLWGPEGHNWHFGIEGDLIAHVLPFDVEKELYAFEGDIDFIHDLNHAFMVVERMRELGWKFRMDSEGVDDYSVNFYKEIPSKSLGYGYEELNFDGVGIAGRAVLLAAKAALEWE